LSPGLKGIVGSSILSSVSTGSIVINFLFGKKGKTIFLQIFFRLRVQEKLTPLVKNFRTSLQYSTIEKEDEHLPPEVNV
jgi:hypothetical protein